MRMAFQTMTRRKVIVMELCNGGSLHTILDDPQSAHGLEQSDFITFLKHISEYSTIPPSIAALSAFWVEIQIFPKTPL